MRHPRTRRRRSDESAGRAVEGPVADEADEPARGRPAGGLRSRRTAALVAGGALAAAAGIGLVSCGSDASDGPAAGPKLTVVDPYIPQPAKAGIAAGYLVVRNDGDTADRLVAVSTPLAPDAAIHRTVGNTMEHVDGIDVPAHGQGVLARGGAHIMFMQTSGPLMKGDIVDVTLTFEKSGSVTLHVPVLGIADRPGDPGVATTDDVVVPGGAAATGNPSDSGSGHAGHEG